MEPLKVRIKQTFKLFKILFRLKGSLSTCGIPDELSGRVLTGLFQTVSFISVKAKVTERSLNVSVSMKNIIFWL